MNQFQDVYLPTQLWGIPAHAAPRTSTRITLAKSGDESRTGLWANPLRKFSMPVANMDWGMVEDAINHFIVMDGPLCTWPWRDPLDCASCPPVPPDEENDYPFGQPITGLDQFIATGDGVTQQFQLIKTRTLGSFSRVRNIYLPVVESVIIMIDGYLPPDVPTRHPYNGPYTFESVTRPGGLITISPPPSPDLTITGGFVWDAEVRWESDDAIQAAVESMDTQSVAPFNFVEVPRC